MATFTYPHAPGAFARKGVEAMSSKRCCVCNEERPLADFNKRTGGRPHYCCRQCQGAYSKTLYQKNKAVVIARAIVSKAKRRASVRGLLAIAKSAPCKDCGILYPPWVMQFDHIVGPKDFILANAPARNFSDALIRAEIAKCELVCANCHAERTHSRRNAPRGTKRDVSARDSHAGPAVSEGKQVLVPAQAIERSRDSEERGRGVIPQISAPRGIRCASEPVPRFAKAGDDPDVAGNVAGHLASGAA